MKIKNIIVGVLIVGIVLAGGIVLRSFVEEIYWQRKTYFDRQWQEKLESEYSNKSKEFLLSKYTRGNSYVAAAAAGVLKKRLDLDITREMLGILEHSKDRGAKFGAMHILAERKDEKCIPVLVAMLKNKDDDEGYIETLYALSEFRYAPVFNEVVALVNNRKHVGSYIAMLENYGTPEAVMLLEKITQENLHPIELGSARQALKVIKARNSAMGRGR